MSSCWSLLPLVTVKLIANAIQADQAASRVQTLSFPLIYKVSLLAKYMFRMVDISLT